jgi:hypothetical protein
MSHGQHKEVPTDKERGFRRGSHYGRTSDSRTRGGASWGSDQKNGQANEHPVHEMNRINVLYCHDLAHQDQWKRSN